MENLQVGQKVYSEPMGNMSRRGNNTIQEFTVSKIGRIFFEVDELPRCRFYIVSGMENTQFTANYKMYHTREEIELKQETYALYTKIERYLGGTVKDISIHKLRQIAEILGI